MVEKLFPDPFLKNQNWVYLWINSLKFYALCFYCMLIWGLSKYIENNLQTTCFTLYKAFLKNKKWCGTSLHFQHGFWRKIFLLLYSINWPNFIVRLPLFREMLGNMCIVIVCWPSCDVINFENHFVFIIKPFFLHDQKAGRKT